MERRPGSRTPSCLWHRGLSCFSHLEVPPPRCPGAGQQPRASPLPLSLRAAPASTQRAAFVKPLRPWGRQPGNGKLHYGVQVPRAAFCPRGLILVLLPLLLEGVKRGRWRPGQAATPLIARGGGQASGEGGRAGWCLHDSLTEPAFCKILCRAAEGLPMQLPRGPSSRPPLYWGSGTTPFLVPGLGQAPWALLLLLEAASGPSLGSEPRPGWRPWPPWGTLSGSFRAHAAHTGEPALRPSPLPPSSAALFLQLSVH